MSHESHPWELFFSPLTVEESHHDQITYRYWNQLWLSGFTPLHNPTLCLQMLAWATILPWHHWWWGFAALLAYSWKVRQVQLWIYRDKGIDLTAAPWGSLEEHREQGRAIWKRFCPEKDGNIVILTLDTPESPVQDSTALWSSPLKASFGNQRWPMDVITYHHHHHHHHHTWSNQERESRWQHNWTARI